MKLLLSFVLLLSQFAFATPVEGILGHWRTEHPQLGRGVDFHLNFEFTKFDMKMDVHCDFHDGAYLETSATSSVDYDNNYIQIRENLETVANDGYHYCRATLRRSVWTAYFDGTGRMVLFVPTPYQSRFYLVQDLN